MKKKTSAVAIRFEDVWFSYGQLSVLQGASFHVHAGQFIALVGANGAGKTTALKLILGLEQPTKGSISLFPPDEAGEGGGTEAGTPDEAGESGGTEAGTPDGTGEGDDRSERAGTPGGTGEGGDRSERAGTPGGTGETERENLIGYVPQNMAWDLAFPISVREVVEMGRLEGGRRFKKKPERARDAQAVQEALELSGVADLAHRPYAALSGGQRRRVLVARALASRPRLLILDEPTANMDSASAARLFKTLESLKGNTTILIVTHDPNYVSALTDVVLCVGEGPRGGDQGRIVRHATVPMEDENLDYLGGPAARVVHGQEEPENCDCGKLGPQHKLGEEN